MFSVGTKDLDRSVAAASVVRQLKSFWISILFWLHFVWTPSVWPPMPSIVWKIFGGCYRAVFIPVGAHPELSWIPWEHSQKIAEIVALPFLFVSACSHSNIVKVNWSKIQPAFWGTIANPTYEFSRVIMLRKWHVDGTSLNEYDLTLKEGSHCWPGVSKYVGANRCRNIVIVATQNIERHRFFFGALSGFVQLWDGSWRAAEFCVYVNIFIRICSTAATEALQHSNVQWENRSTGGQWFGFLNRWGNKP